jgi:hypothetical protein
MHYSDLVAFLNINFGKIKNANAGAIPLVRKVPNQQSGIEYIV